MFILSVNITDKDIIFGGVMYYITLNNSSHILFTIMIFISKWRQIFKMAAKFQ